MKERNVSGRRPGSLCKVAFVAGSCATSALAAVLVLVPVITQVLGIPAPGADACAVLRALAVLSPLSMCAGKVALMRARCEGDPATAFHRRRLSGTRGERAA